MNINELKFVIYRPHANVVYKNTVKNLFLRRRAPNKYSLFFDYLLQSKCKLYLSTRLEQPITFLQLIKNLLDRINLMLWLKFNRIHSDSIEIISTIKNVNKCDVFYTLFYENLSHEKNIIAHNAHSLAKSIGAINIFKIVNMTHYFYNVDLGSKNLKEFAPDLLIAENDLEKNSSFYKTFFKNIEAPFRAVSFVPAARFLKKNDFHHRKNKMVATGTITYKVQDTNFNGFFNVDELQPLRRLLYERKNEYLKEMDCLISDLNATRMGTKTFYEKILEGIRNQYPQKDYFNKDVVSIYNGYRMFCVTEEVADLPAIGFVEGMACGCVFIGIDNPMYTDLGLLPGVHYISHDGTIGDLMAKVSYYQMNEGDLSRIADAGHEFVHQKLTAKIVYEKFMSEVVRLASLRMDCD